MGRRWKYGAFLVVVMLLLLNYKCLSLNSEVAYVHESKLGQGRNLQVIPPYPNITRPPSIKPTGTIPPKAEPPIEERQIQATNTTQNSSEVTQEPATQSSPTIQPTYIGPASSKGSNKWVYLATIPVAGLLVLGLACTVLVWKKKGGATIRPWRTGLSGPLQQAFVTGIPKLNRLELEGACEEFSNIIATYPEVTVFKGTLSSGVEIVVASTTVKSANDWSKDSEMCFRKEIEMLTRINHKNFINLLGYCEEEVPFTRMLVFEYATNGPLFEHLHVEGNEPLHWNARVRIIMGIAYCLQHIHGLDPSIAHQDLNSSSIFLTENYAAKVSDGSVWKEVIRKGNTLGNEIVDSSEEKSADMKSNIFSFGMLLLEIITGRLAYSDDFSLLNLALDCIKETGSISTLVDPTLRSYKPEELDIIWEVIQECTQLNPQQRPEMREIVSKLRQVLAISPENAAPRHSPLWWAELEILSV